MKTLAVLRKKYPTFFYKGYAYALENGDLNIVFDFVVPAASRNRNADIQFHPRVLIKNVSSKALQKKGTLDNLIFHLGLMEIPSYWKATCSPEIVVEAGYLTKTQIRWWHDLFMKGMGEYFYRNRIAFTRPNFLTITSEGPILSEAKDSLASLRMNERTMVPVGGGKDAVVTVELLKKAKQDSVPFLLNPKKEQGAILTVAGLKNPIVVHRTIDPKLLQLNRTGYLNGHTPFSAYLAFLSVLCAALFDIKYIALSNERSSNEGNTQYLGKTVNHQYSKSFEFEKKFRSYTKTYLAEGIEYFSFLRPLFEIQIARLFSLYPKYFPAFVSCNEAHKAQSRNTQPTGTWCGHCPKCLFVFAALYPFVTEQLLVAIFKKNLFEDPTLIPLLEELVGEREVKPFECVGTRQESRVAFLMALQKHPEPLPVLLSHFKTTILPKYPQLGKEQKTILSAWNKNHALPPKLEQLLKKAL